MPCPVPGGTTARGGVGKARVARVAGTPAPPRPGQARQCSCAWPGAGVPSRSVWHNMPAVGGLALGIELYDFNGGAGLTIPSQNGVGGWDATHRSYSTHRGLGFLYPRKWYCIEMRWRMNTTKPYSLPPVGTHWLEGGHNVDGYIEWWVDGISAARTPLFAHRSSAAFVDWALKNAAGQPYVSVAGTPDRLRGISNVPPELYMGASEIVFNAYYGGRTYNDSDKYVYLNGIVASSGAHIGPMAGVSRENGGLG